MLAALLVAAALTAAAPKENDCRSEQTRAECAELMGLLFRSADSYSGVAVRTRAEPATFCAVPTPIQAPPCVSRWIVRPRFIVRLEGQRVLITENEGQDVSHAEPGSWSAYHFDPSEPRLLRAFRDFARSGSFGYPGEGSLIFIEGQPAFYISAGGTWQGESCLWASIDLITPAGPRSLIPGFLLTYSSGETTGESMSAEVETLSLSSAVITYSDGSRFTFARRDTGPMRPNAETPRRC